MRPIVAAAIGAPFADVLQLPERCSHRSPRRCFHRDAHDEEPAPNATTRRGVASA